MMVLFWVRHVLITRNIRTPLEVYQLWNKEGSLVKCPSHCFPRKLLQISPRPIPWIDHTRRISTVCAFARADTGAREGLLLFFLWLLKRGLINIHPPSESGYLEKWGNARSIRSSLVKAFQTPWATRPSEDWMLMLGGQSHHHGHQDGQSNFMFRVNFDVAEPLNIPYLSGQVTAPPRMPRLW